MSTIQQLAITKRGKFLVKAVQTDGKVVCWGQVVRSKGTRTEHDGERTFLASKIELQTVEITETLVAELTRQTTEDPKYARTAALSQRMDRELGDKLNRLAAGDKTALLFG